MTEAAHARQRLPTSGSRASVGAKPWTTRGSLSCGTCRLCICAPLTAQSVCSLNPLKRTPHERSAIRKRSDSTRPARTWPRQRPTCTPDNNDGGSAQGESRVTMPDPPELPTHTGRGPVPSSSAHGRCSRPAGVSSTPRHRSDPHRIHTGHATPLVLLPRRGLGGVKRVPV